MLQSQLNEHSEPCVYLCPNNQLVAQTCEQAKRFGIPYTVAPKDLPGEFVDGEKILITSVQKMFHGYSKFGLDSKALKLQSVVLDDAHLCIDNIKNLYKIKVDSKHALYIVIKSIFTSALKNQGVGTYSDIEKGDYDSVLSIPYYEWQLKYEDVTLAISKLSEDKSICYSWPLLKDVIKYCNCIISGTSLEIFLDTPILNRIKSFTEAKSRIFMSATLSDDSIFVKDLGVCKIEVEKPFYYDEEKWSGEKLILIPQSIDKKVKREFLIKAYTDKITDYGVAVLTPSNKISREWKSDKTVLVNANDIEANINKLKTGDYSQTMVFSNRYDGIDLPDNSCRALIIDGKPSGSSLEDRYYEMCLGETSYF